MHRGRPSTLLEFLVIALLVLGVRAVAAGSLGRIVGKVTGSGTAIPGATVRITCGKVVRTVKADAAGAFTAVGLPLGTCSVTAAAAGYAAAAIQVQVAAETVGSVTLALAAAPQPATKKPAPPKTRDVDKEMPVAAEPALVSPTPIVAGRLSVASARGRVGPMTQRPDEGPNTEAYSRIDDNEFQRSSTAPLSTFSVDVDTASYSNLRRFLREGKAAPKDAIRIEELINYFTYDYPAPKAGDPFSVTTEVGPAPWAPTHQLVRIGLKAPEIDDRQVPARNLVFLLDVSGSMDDPNKLPLLKQAMGLLIDNLRPEDKVSIAVYAGAEGMALAPTAGSDKSKIRQAVFALEPGGSTNGAAGIQLAYNMAEANLIKNGINRVILCTDGDFNVGTTSEGDLTRLIEKERERGVFLTVLGFGMGNLKDSTMEKLANRGNGNYGYIDSLMEARKLLVKEAGATLVTVAKDVKLQVEFNPALVAGYRLIGYENRMLRNEDFNDDKKDAGEIGAGHSVTALYEIVPAGVEVPAAKVDDLKYQPNPAKPGAVGAAGGELMTVKVRYKEPNGATSKLMSQPVKASAGPVALSTDFQWATAIAGFGMMLRESPHRGALTWKQVQALAAGAIGKDVEGYRKQAVELMKLAATHRP
jgi:Ca-activated chloride channel homolog